MKFLSKSLVSLLCLICLVSAADDEVWRYVHVRKLELNKYNEGKFAVQVVKAGGERVTLTVHRSHFKDHYQYLQTHNMLMKALEGGNTLSVQYEDYDLYLDKVYMYKIGLYADLVNE